eukprot:scaffold3463_cov636-Pavlova_lutheri.AAC.1
MPTICDGPGKVCAVSGAAYVPFDRAQPAGDAAVVGTGRLEPDTFPPQEGEYSSNVVATGA